MKTRNKILIIDDESDFVETLKEKLEFSGYEVSFANDGLLGMEKIKQEKPDIILLDILMPKMDGYNLLKKLKSDQNIKNTSVLIVTAKSGMKDLFSQEEVAGYFVKPFDHKLLIAKIEQVLGNKR